MEYTQFANVLFVYLTESDLQLSLGASWQS